jgi:hypothetical protein
MSTAPLGALAHDLAFEFGQGHKQVEGESPLGGRGVDRIVEALQADPAGHQGRDDREQRNVRHQTAVKQAELILQAALNPAIASRAKKGEFVTCFDHFELLQTAINRAPSVTRGQSCSGSPW